MSKRYLLKFVEKYSHAKMLTRGELFCRPSKYYRQLELGQGDPGEGTIFPGVCIYTHSNNLIFCLFDSYELDTDFIKISKKNFDDFSFNYVVVIEFSIFDKALTDNFEDNEYEVIAGNVQYGRPEFNYQSELLVSNSPDNLFIKHPYFKHQQEFRVYCAQSLENGDFKILKLNKNISKFCKIFKRKELIETEDSYILNINNIGF